MKSPGQNNEIAWFFACCDPFKKKKKKKIFLINNLLGGNGQKWECLIWLQESKIECISGMNSWNKLIFYMMLQIQES